MCAGTTAAKKTFSDPCPLLNETDKARLAHRLKCLQALAERPELGSPLYQNGGALYAAAEAFLGDLQNRHDFWREHFEQDDHRAVRALYVRTLAVYGPAVEGVERQEEKLSLHDLKQNPLMSRLLGDPAAAPRGLSNAALFASEPVTSYFYKGKPFAVSSQRYLLTPVNAQGEQETLDELETVIEAMTSPEYHRQAAKRFLELANRLTSRPGASRKAVSLLRAWSVRQSRLAEEAESGASAAAMAENPQTEPQILRIEPEAGGTAPASAGTEAESSEPETKAPETGPEPMNADPGDAALADAAGEPENGEAENKEALSGAQEEEPASNAEEPESSEPEDEAGDMKSSDEETALSGEAVEAEGGAPEAAKPEVKSKKPQPALTAKPETANPEDA